MDVHLGLDSSRSRLDSIKEQERSSELSLNQRLGFFLLSRRLWRHGPYIYIQATGHRRLAQSSVVHCSALPWISKKNDWYSNTKNKLHLQTMTILRRFIYCAALYCLLSSCHVLWLCGDYKFWSVWKRTSQWNQSTALQADCKSILLYIITHSYQNVVLIIYHAGPEIYCMNKITRWLSMLDGIQTHLFI